MNAPRISPSSLSSSSSSSSPPPLMSYAVTDLLRSRLIISSGIFQDVFVHLANSSAILLASCSYSYSHCSFCGSLYINEVATPSKICRLRQVLWLMALFRMQSKNLQVIQLTKKLLFTKKNFLLHIDIREVASVSLRNCEVNITESTNQAAGFL